MYIIILVIVIIYFLSNTNNQPKVKQELKENFIYSLITTIKL
jgi:hypothetical protein